MDLSLYRGNVFEAYKSNSQRIRRLSESWFKDQMYCPACTSDNLEAFANNKPVADFFCPECEEHYQLKSQSKAFTGRVLDGAYSTMISAIQNETQPNFFLLQYTPSNWSVVDLNVIPKFFFTESIIEKRNPLSENARRAGWVGCNILISRIPLDGRISVVNDCFVNEPEVVRSGWQDVSFVKEKKVSERSWITDVIWCVDQLGKDTFTLQELYGFEGHLAKLHPKNNNIRPKIRQQLQFLRDKKYLKFRGSGRYQLVK